MATNRKTPSVVEEPVKSGVIALTSRKDKPEVERVPLFSINGVEYTVPTSVPQTTGLRYTNIARKHGAEAAADFMMETLLGEEGYQALLAFEDLTEEDLSNVFEACTHIMNSVSQGKA